MTSNSSFVDALARTEFVRRHIGPSAVDLPKMLDVIGVASVRRVDRANSPGQHSATFTA